MKKSLSYLALSASVLLFAGCGGDQLLDAGNDTNHLVPEADTNVPDDRARPPEDAPTMSTSGTQLLDVEGEPVLLRGINLKYGDDPTARFESIMPIRETGSNIVRVELREDSTIDEVEAILNAAVDNELIVILSLWEEEIACQADENYLLEKTATLWLDEWLPAISQRRFQDHLMINVGSEWGPMGVFDAYSFGYDSYIDTHKILIRQFRAAGFKLPIVIDAPNCGEDHYAFLGARGRELMAADDEDNLVLSVNAVGARWNSNDEIVRAMNLLAEENVPVIVSKFKGSGVGGEDLAIDHMQLMRIGNGDRALSFDMPWAQSDDKAAFVTMLDESYNLNNATISVDVFVDQAFVDDGQLALVMYMKDTGWRYANLGWNQANSMTGNSWNRIRIALTDTSSIPGYVSDDFDLSAVNQIGFEIVANGKAVDVNAPIKFDNLTISRGETVGPMYDEDFNVDTGGWGGGWGSASLSQADSNLEVLPDWTAGDNFAKTLTGAGVIDFTQDLTITARVFLPEEYADESGLYFKFFGQFGDAWTWVQSRDAGFADFAVGDWADIVFEVNYSDGDIDVGTVQAWGMQMGGVSTAKTAPILFDSIVVSGPPPELPPLTQYIAEFSSDLESWANLGWGAGGAIIQADGAMSVTPDWGSGDNIAIGRNSIATVDTLDFTGPTTLRAKVFVPAEYAGSGLWFKFFMQDGDDWTWFETATLGIADFVPGDWAQLEFDLGEFSDGFARNLRPNGFGLQFGGTTAAGAVLIDDIEIIGVGEAEAEELLNIGFDLEAQAEAFSFDFGEGSFDASSTAEASSWAYGTFPFGWVASVWTGAEGDEAALNISNMEDMLDLTERGSEIVDGANGIMATSQDPNFLPVEEVETR